MCISSIEQSNENSIKFSLSTWTRSSSKISQSKFLYKSQWTCYESPKKEMVFHAFKHLIQNLKSYNKVKV